MKRQISVALGFVVLAVAISQAYTNCSPAFQFAGLPETGAKESSLVVTHPPEEKVQAPSQSPPLAHRVYIEQIMLDVFTAPNSSGGYVNALKNQMRAWVTYQGANLGRACNLYESASGRDCGGDPSNTNLPHNQADTVVREALRIHLCEEVLAYDEAVAAALSKVTGAGAEPAADKIAPMTALFYRGDLPSQEFITVLTEMDADLKTAGATGTDRWRMLLMQTCESPDWQIL